MSGTILKTGLVPGFLVKKFSFTVERQNISSKTMKVLLVEPFFGGSHKAWAEGLSKQEGLDFTFLTLPSRWWKWRMYGGAVALSRRFERMEISPDVVLASSMLDLATFQGLTRRRLADTPHLLYFHENQFAYPGNEDRDLDDKDRHYCFINYLSALGADSVAFNSKYNRDTFFEGLESMLRAFPEYRSMDTIDEIKRKSRVIPLGFDFDAPEQERSSSLEKGGLPVILWNHRWEHDKNPAEFFQVLRNIKKRGCVFRLIICGESYSNRPEEFDHAKSEFADEIIHFGFAKTRNEYIRLLARSDFLPVTSLQEFFGISVVEAAWAGVIPLLPERLSYPEIFPVRNFPELYYSPGSLEALLQKKMDDVSGVKSLQARLRNRLARYGWRKVYPAVDSWMREFV